MLPGQINAKCDVNVWEANTWHL